MSSDGVTLKLQGSTFKGDLLEIIGGVLTAGARTLVALKTGGTLVAIAPNLVSDFFGALKNFKREETLELRAWLLISGALLYALEKTVQELAPENKPSAEDFAKLTNDIAERVNTRTYTIEPDFFSNPNRLGLLDDVSHEFSAWIGRFGKTYPAKDIRVRLESHFPSGLHRTWMKDVGRFSPLEQALNSPFAQALLIAQEYDGYLQYVEEQFTGLRLIGQDEDSPNAITLAQVFVPLRAYYEKYEDKDGLSESVDATNRLAVSAERSIPRQVVSFLPELDSWISKADKQDPIRIVSGGPGIGKSSSMRAFATRVARLGAAYPVLVPLQKLERPEQALRERIRHYLIDTGDIPFWATYPLDVDNRQPLRVPIVLIFDGLDELVRPGRDADEIAKDFVFDLRGMLEQENGFSSVKSARVLAIVTGRIASASTGARALKLSGSQILSLLPFALALLIHLK